MPEHKPTPEELAAAQAEIQRMADDGVIEVNGRRYVVGRMLHKQRRKVLAFFSDPRVRGLMQAGSVSYVEWAEFEPVEAVILSSVSIDGRILSKAGDDHWEQFPQDYPVFIGRALAVISAPFLSGGPTG